MTKYIVRTDILHRARIVAKRLDSAAGSPMPTTGQKSASVDPGHRYDMADVNFDGTPIVNLDQLAVAMGVHRKAAPWFVMEQPEGCRRELVSEAKQEIANPPTPPSIKNRNSKNYLKDKKEILRSVEDRKEGGSNRRTDELRSSSDGLTGVRTRGASDTREVKTAHDLVFFQNRNTPKVLSRGKECKPKAGYGKIVKRRPATADEEAAIRRGDWVRVDVHGNKPGDSGYHGGSNYRPQLRNMKKQLAELIETKQRRVASRAGERRYKLPIGTPLGQGGQMLLPLDLPDTSHLMEPPNNPRVLQTQDQRNSLMSVVDQLQPMLEEYHLAEEDAYSGGPDREAARAKYKALGDKLDALEIEHGNYDVASGVAEGPWVKFGPCRQIREAAYDVLGYPTDDSPAHDPHVIGGIRPTWGGADFTVDEQTARIHAAVLLEEIKDSQPASFTLYRGVQISNPEDMVATLKESSTFDMPLASFSPQRKTANNFGKDIVFVLQKGAKSVQGASMGNPNPEEDDDGWENYDEPEYCEHITGGRFIVTGVRQNQDGFTVMIRQQAHYDIRTGRLVKNTKDEDMDTKQRWQWSSLFDGSLANPMYLAKQKQQAKVIELLGIQTKDLVRTPEGAAVYKQPIGSTIRRHIHPPAQINAAARATTPARGRSNRPNPVPAMKPKAVVTVHHPDGRKEVYAEMRNGEVEAGRTHEDFTGSDKHVAEIMQHHGINEEHHIISGQRIRLNHLNGTAHSINPETGRGTQIAELGSNANGNLVMKLRGNQRGSTQNDWETALGKLADHANGMQSEGNTPPVRRATARTKAKRITAKSKTVAAKKPRAPKVVWPDRVPKPNKKRDPNKKYLGRTLLSTGHTMTLGEMKETHMHLADPKTERLDFDGDPIPPELFNSGQPVWVANNGDTMLQVFGHVRKMVVTGKDKDGKAIRVPKLDENGKEILTAFYGYSQAWEDSQNQVKHGRGAKFAEDGRDKFIKYMTKAKVINRNDPDEDNNAVHHMLFKTGMRVDSETEGTGADTNRGTKAYGGSSLESRHVTVDVNNNVHIEFEGKMGVINTYDSDDPLLAQIMRDRKKNKKPDDRLFPNANVAKMGKNLKEITGMPDIKNHDLRTHMATNITRNVIANPKEFELPTVPADPPGASKSYLKVLENDRKLHARLKPMAAKVKRTGQWPVATTPEEYDDLKKMMAWKARYQLNDQWAPMFDTYIDAGLFGPHEPKGA